MHQWLNIHRVVGYRSGAGIHGTGAIGSGCVDCVELAGFCECSETSQHVLMPPLGPKACVFGGWGSSLIENSAEHARTKDCCCSALDQICPYHACPARSIAQRNRAIGELGRIRGNALYMCGDEQNRQ